TARVDLYPERIVIVSNLRKSAFPRGSFVRASWAKGVSVTLERSDGSFLKLPDVVGNSQGLTNSLRAWIKRSRVETYLCVYGLLPHVKLIDPGLLHHGWIGAVVYPSSKWR